MPKSSAPSRRTVQHASTSISAGRRCSSLAQPDKTAAAPQAPYFGLEHIGLTVTDIDGITAELKDKGADFTMQPTTVRPGVRIAFLRGPEGVLVELIQRG
jgi:catechol 2,3-dioxygenase-like lactoylglutathione lyase family enzyme